MQWIALVLLHLQFLDLFISFFRLFQLEDLFKNEDLEERESL